MKKKIREDSQGLFISGVDGLCARPGNVDGYHHAHRMDAHDLKAGDEVKANHVSQSPMVRIVCPDGVVLLWQGQSEWDSNGKRIKRHD